MNSFEMIVSDLFQREGYWTKLNYKLQLSPEEKKTINKESIPAIDIDIVAYRPGEILLIECKSYFGSHGVSYKDLFESGKNEANYKMFTMETYREVVMKALMNDLIERKMANEKDTLQLGLVSGKIYGGDGGEEKIKIEFENRKWLFWGPEDLKKKLLKSKDQTIWEDSIVSVVTKILG